MFTVSVWESDSCAICHKTGSDDNPMVVLSDRRKRRDESTYISFHVNTCWPKMLGKATQRIHDWRIESIEKANAAIAVKA